MQRERIWDEIERESVNHRTIPFWSWNDKLETDELKEQIDEMSKAGFGGFIMHARAGLMTPFMQDEWMNAVQVSMDEAEKQGLECWVYDENGWPSGFADGKVPRLGEQYQQKGLQYTTIQEGNELPDGTLGVYRITGDCVKQVENPLPGDIAVYVVVNPYYIDALNSESVTRFLEQIHEKYYARFRKDFGTRLKGFFTDEPQYANGLIPWSPVLEEALNQSGVNAREHLGALFFDTSDDRGFRCQYYRKAADLFCKGFVAQMSQWCHEHGVLLTGHVMAEDSLDSQLRCTGGVMPTYAYFDCPGIDWLGRKISSPVTPKQLGSVAAQLRKKCALSESFALCGWDVRFNELRWIAQWQFVNGVNILCQHLSAYSLRGLRKRDYPASLYIQSPWFCEYKVLQDYFAKTGAALTLGTDATDVLLVQPLANVAGHYTNSEYSTVSDLSREFETITSELSGHHILHHYGDETLMTEYGRVDGRYLFVGGCRYRAVVFSPCDSITAGTAALLSAFVASGGVLVAIKKVPTLVDYKKDAGWNGTASKIHVVESVSDSAKWLRSRDFPHLVHNGREEELVHIAVRILENGQRLYYLASLASEEIGNRELRLNGRVGLKELNLITGQETVLMGCFDGNCTSFNLHFDEAESHLLISVSPTLNATNALPAKLLSFSPKWDIANATPNALTLDKCAYRIDEGEWQPEQAIIRIQNQLLLLCRPCRVELAFHFQIENLSEIGNIRLGLETPEKYSIFVNDVAMSFTDTGWFCDKSFRCSKIRDYLHEGENTILLSTQFAQSQKVYEVLFNKNIHEAEKNKLTLDSELESIYLLGDFSVTSRKITQFTERNALWVEDSFVMAPPPQKVEIENITTQGFYFFAGRMRLRQIIHCDVHEGKRILIKLSKMRVCVAKVFVNGSEAGILALSPYELDVTHWMIQGENCIELELFTGCRNMLGPHHRAIGESYFVSPDTFSDRPDWEGGTEPYWRDDYCFVTTGVTFSSEQSQ